MTAPTPIEVVRQALEANACEHPRRTGYRTLAANGTSMIAAYCVQCRSKVTDWIPHEWLRRRGVEPSDVPLLYDYSGTGECARCGSTDGTEVHHFAPKHLFDDYDQWPTADLCRSCHDEWHRKTRTGSYYHEKAAS